MKNNRLVTKDPITLKIIKYFIDLPKGDNIINVKGLMKPRINYAEIIIIIVKLTR